MGAHPVVLDARAQPGDLGSLEDSGRGGAGARSEVDQRETQRDLERRRGGQAGTGRQTAADLQARAHERKSGPRQLGDGPAHERPPPVDGRRVGERELVALAEIGGSLDPPLAGGLRRPRLGAHGDALSIAKGSARPWL